MEKKYSVQQGRIRALFLVIALLTTALLFVSFHSYFGKHRIRIVNRKSTDANVNVYFYHDFDRDGMSELILVKHAPETHQDGLKFFTAHNGLVDQWTCNEPVFANAVYFGDYDGDDYDEVYFFTKGNDSLFLYSFDPRQQNSFIIFRKLIATAPRPNPNRRKIWDVGKPEAVFYDSDKDGFKEVYIALNAGFSLHPREMVKFDIKRQKITARSKQGTIVAVKPILVDLNDDEIPELLMENSGAPANAPSDMLFSDHYPWLTVFDLNLNFFFKPIHFPYPFSGINTKIWRHNRQKYLAVLYDYHGIHAFPPTLYLYSSQGKLLRKKKLFSKYNWHIFSLPHKEYTYLYLTNEAGDIYKLNDALNEIWQKSLSNPILYIKSAADFDMDGQTELFARGKQGYCIFKQDFSEETRLVEIPPDYRDHISVKYEGLDKKPAIIIQTSDFLYFLRYEKNPYRFLLIPTILLVFFLFYGLCHLVFNHFQNKFYEREIKRELGQFLHKGLLILDTKGRIRTVNATFEQILKLQRHIQPKTHFRHALEERKKMVQLIETLIAQQTFLERSCSLPVGQDAISLKFQGIVLRGFLNIPVGFLILLDTYEFEYMSQRLQIWVQTIQKMAHDIKAPLSSIQLGLQTLQMKLESPEPQERNISNDFTLLNNELQRVRSLTKQFLRFTSLEKPKLSAIDLENFLNKSIQKFRHFTQNESLQIDVEIDPTARTISADPFLLEMVLQVLLENAIEALAGNGRILITANVIRSPKDNFKEFVEIEISDNGPGIPEENLDKVFEPFYSTKTNGTGLGLAIAKNIIEAHQGSISITSREGFSTIVRILIPFIPTEQNE